MNRLERSFVKRNYFNLSHDRKFDCDFGQLIPIMCEEILPGDTFKVNTDMLVRLSPMVSPMYHEVNVTTRYFFVPDRLTWDSWQDFITGGRLGTSAPQFPTITFNNIATYSLADYFGLPVNVAYSEMINALPFRAYLQIYNDWFRDQTAQAEIAFSKSSGVDVTTPTTLLYVNWEKDYFTSALPFTQRGNPVTLSLGGTAPVTFTGQIPLRAQNATEDVEIFAPPSAAPGPVQTAAPGLSGVALGVADTEGTDPANTLAATADLSAATPITINDLRLATQTQRVLEILARTGGRYIEYLMGIFGIRSSDARLQRSEYLGGGKSQIVVSEVLQTSETATTPQGNMAGHGFSAHRSHEFKKSFEEHGYVIGLMYVLPRTAYCQGVPRMWSRTSRWDFFIPQFAHLGEQAVLKKEIWLDAADGQNDQVFGYQGRGDEYRRRESSVHGNFRAPLGLGSWHMARIFASRPALNSAFITADTVTKRPFADTSDPPLWVYLKNNVKALRPLPKVGVPGLMDH